MEVLCCSLLCFWFDSQTSYFCLWHRSISETPCQLPSLCSPEKYFLVILVHFVWVQSITVMLVGLSNWCKFCLSFIVAFLAHWHLNRLMHRRKLRYATLLDWICQEDLDFSLCVSLNVILFKESFSKTKNIPFESRVDGLGHSKSTSVLVFLLSVFVSLSFF